MFHKLIVIAVLVAASSCATPASEPRTPAASPASRPTVTPSPIETPLKPISPIPLPAGTIEHRASLQRARDDLAARLNIDPKEITITRVDSIEITIPDTACVPDQNPQPGIPAQIVGEEIILSARGQSYVYHAHGSVVQRCTAQMR